MEKIIEEFLRIETGSGTGTGAGYGYGCGYGCGDGTGSGTGDGDGSGTGDGDGSGTGAGYGYGCGYGCGYGDGYGISKFNKKKVYSIDGVQTIIKKVKGNIAKGYILGGDLMLEPCYIAKGHNKFAHGKTVRKAVEDLQNKIFEDMDSDEAIELFLKEFELDKKYKGKEFYIWHNRLTGSCEMGRDSFVKNKGINLEDMFTVQEFIELTKDDYGGDIIRKVEQNVNSRRMV